MSTPPQAGEVALPSHWDGERLWHAPSREFRMPLDPPDEELIARLRAGDADALEILIDRYSRLFMGIGLRILGDFGEAEEIVQEIFLYLYRKAALYLPERGTANKWIVQVAYHRALDRSKYLRRRGFYSGTDIDSLSDTLMGEIDLDREIGAKLSRAQLEKAFEELPERQRQTLELFYFQGLDLPEICERLNEPLANVRHHYYRGLEKLRKSSLIRKMREK
jgi:RNA polymerase sigma-70 factor (ECF subfamily)